MALRMATWTATRVTKTCTSLSQVPDQNTISPATSTKKDYKERQCSAALPFSMFLILKNLGNYFRTFTNVSGKHTFFNPSASLNRGAISLSRNPAMPQPMRVT